tara:strand:+ start:525 stop:1658 length:1134 start_codon:yes stop_codon:yes gene_type:complete
LINLNSSNKKLTYEIRDSVDLINEHDHFTFVTRASWAIFAALTINKTKKEQIIAMPSFICQSTVAAAIKAGWKIHFLDIDIVSGNVPSENYINAVNSNQIDAILFVHLLGNFNPVKQLFEICKQKSVFVIEDSAQICTERKEFERQDLADIKLYSFGYSKPIDVGGGGIVCTNDKHFKDCLEDFHGSYKFKSQENLKEVSMLFRKTFFSIKNSLSNSTNKKEDFKNLLNIYMPLIDVNIKLDKKMLKSIIHGIKYLSQTNARRIDNLRHYQNYITNKKLSCLNSSNSIPWRVCYRIVGSNYEQQKYVSEFLRRKGFDVSNYYLPSHWYVDPSKHLDEKLKNTVKLSKEIIQFWVDKDFNPSQFLKLKNNINHIFNDE